MGAAVRGEDQSPGPGSQHQVDPGSGPQGPDKGKGLTLPRQVLLAVLGLLGDPHLGQDESGSVPDLGNRDVRACSTPPSTGPPRAPLTL